MNIPNIILVSLYIISLISPLLITLVVMLRPGKPLEQKLYHVVVDLVMAIIFMVIMAVVFFSAYPQSNDSALGVAFFYFVGLPMEAMAIIGIIDAVEDL